MSEKAGLYPLLVKRRGFTPAYGNKTLGITATLHPNINLNVRKSWLWAFSIQVVYGLRIHEVFAIQNLTEPFTMKDDVIIPALNDKSNTDNLLVIGKLTDK